MSARHLWQSWRLSSTGQRLLLLLPTLRMLRMLLRLLRLRLLLRLLVVLVVLVPMLMLMLVLALVVLVVLAVRRCAGTRLHAAICETDPLQGRVDSHRKKLHTPHTTIGTADTRLGQNNMTD
jgi:hypothetical protein